MNTRNLIYFVLLLSFACHGTKQPDSNTKKSNSKVDTIAENLIHRIYIGTYTGTGSDGIYTATFRSDSATLSSPILASELKNPSFQTISKDGKLLYSVCEADGSGIVSAFKIDKESGALTSIGNSSSHGNGPCFVSYQNTTSNVCVANYGSGIATSLKTDENGGFNGIYSADQHVGTGPQTDRQEAPHAHCFKFDLDEKYGYSCDLGADKIYVYSLVNDSLNTEAEIPVTTGFGPRHIDFHPTKKLMAVVGELKGTVSTFSLDEKGIFSVPVQVVSTLPSDFKEFSKAADIHFTPNGKFLYVSNRGHNSLAIFKVTDNLMLEPVGWQIENCVWTRNFAIDPSGKYLLAANRNSNNIVVFEINQESGQLNFTGKQISIAEPVCITFLN